MERELKAAYEGNLDEFDLEGLLEDSKIEGIDLSKFDSKSKFSDEVLDSEMDE